MNPLILDISIYLIVLHSVTPINATIFPILFVRDLKAENILLEHDGLWKVCDFGSISTNHQRFKRPEDMGIEEDNIRKHTTPAYRAPEMWDQFRRELINEKVDIWVPSHTRLPLLRSSLSYREPMGFLPPIVFATGRALVLPGLQESDEAEYEGASHLWIPYFSKAYNGLVELPILGSVKLMV
ncbi:hypothetical protein GIB67_026893 [Kingdonia uniflora]|uniref:non-specific serine/threonine protein kinase n=1 Tax=Kingdonia uniflora TaxID=39325 RepID=A0A7J7M7Z9_9MAGN|nr:hypothetical protein GIB67_026893 [Kingdonia uniflora]